MKLYKYLILLVVIIILIAGTIFFLNFGQIDTELNVFDEVDICMGEGEKTVVGINSCVAFVSEDLSVCEESKGRDDEANEEAKIRCEDNYNMRMALKTQNVAMCSQIQDDTKRKDCTFITSGNCDGFIYTFGDFTSSAENSRIICEASKSRDSKKCELISGTSKTHCFRTVAYMKALVEKDMGAAKEVDEISKHMGEVYINWLGAYIEGDVESCYATESFCIKKSLYNGVRNGQVEVTCDDCEVNFLEIGDCEYIKDKEINQMCQRLFS